MLCVVSLILQESTAFYVTRKFNVTFFLMDCEARLPLPSSANMGYGTLGSAKHSSILANIFAYLVLI